MKALLERIYGKEKGDRAFVRLSRLLDAFEPRPRKRRDAFSARDAVLITYGDALRREGEPPLQTLCGFAQKWFRDAFSTIHILPFFPFSSDDGFSVMDFKAADPALGDWQDVKALGRDFDLMFDFVLNHVSARSPWFEKCLRGENGFADLAVEVDPAADLSGVTRPRALPLLTPFEKASGETVHVWTTFSADQIDLNYRSLDVLEKMVAVMLFYVGKGATVLRLDAVAYLWKEIGTSCIHLPQTHDMVRLFRKILDRVAPDVKIITETNAPHAENISYFGDGADEAQMVYNFTLPPLLLHAFIAGDAAVLSAWADGLRPPSDRTAFLNFTASHDGIGVRPLEGVLPAAEIDRVVERAVQNGGRVSSKSNPDGSQSPYELNVTYVDALRDGRAEHDLWHVQRFLASQAVQYALPGVPATYIHSILGSRNWEAGVRRTGRARTINREKLDADSVERELRDPERFRSRIFFPYLRMIKTRIRQPAFHPHADCRILDVGPRVFGVRRRAADQTIWALTNVSDREVAVSLHGPGGASGFTDLLTGRACGADIRLAPYAYVWLTGAG